jgi:hypothetical protein
MTSEGSSLQADTTDLTVHPATLPIGSYFHPSSACCFVIWMLNKEGESGDWQTKKIKSLGYVFKLGRGKIGMQSLISALPFD